jgi:hypothetical protein
MRYDTTVGTKRQRSGKGCGMSGIASGNGMTQQPMFTITI